MENDNFSQDDLKEQLDDPDSALFLALHMYYHEKISQLLKQHKIPDTKNNLYSLAADSVTKNGWLVGVELVKGKILSVKYEPLLTTVIAMISLPPAPQPTPAPTLVDTSWPDTTPLETTTPIKQPETNTLKTTKQIQNQPPKKESTTATVSVSKPTTTAADVPPPVKVTDKDAEVAIVQKCRTTAFLQLQHLMQADELKYIDKTLKEISQDIINRFYREQQRHFQTLFLNV
ncbi:unnamed protein product [Didymodactylos carnosus]|uniref:Uncharacterized protein n=1 Tax=Didymodactylos carnosus TaxID=1234261 RepID=A0A815ADX2_9BILA|nr:unnamed protein product [Didymodactylos carnosus]CAF4024096.1 unnamed protein product [Didymodactylos carnosus]